MSEIFFNPYVKPTRHWDLPTDAPREFHRRMPGYLPTPLHALPLLATRFGASSVHLKDESRRLDLPAFKILGASWATYRAFAEKLRFSHKEWKTIDDLRALVSKAKQTTLFSATDGNHGRAVARMGALLGLPVKIFMPKGTVQPRIDAIKSEGAEVIIIDGTYDDAVKSAEKEAGNNGVLIQDTGWEGYETVPRRIVAGYSTMMWEISEELAALGKQQPNMIVVQVGVGSLAEAVVRHFRAYRPRKDLRIFGVEPERSACALESVKANKIVHLPGPHDSIMAGMNCGTISSTSWEVLRDGIDFFISISDEKAREAMRVLAREKIISGETGGAGVGAMLELLEKAPDGLGLPPDTDVLLFSTEGATDPESYASIVGHSPDDVN